MTIRKLPTKLLQLFLGFFLIALGVIFMRYSNLGLNPWGTFHDGVSKITGLRFGTVTQLTGFTIICISMLLKISPGIGTLLNMYFCGFFINLIDDINIIPHPETLLLKVIYLVLGIWILAVGIYTYISVGLGAGPRDGLMVGLVKITKYNVSVIRTVIELSALLVGFLLGGTVGIGTVISAFSIGYAIQVIFKLRKYDSKKVSHLSIVQFFTMKYK